MRKYIDVVIKEWKSWKSHPAKVDFCMEIAHNLMCLDRRDEAREFWQYFKDSGVAPERLSAWAREDVAALDREFAGEPQRQGVAP